MNYPQKYLARLLPPLLYVKTKAIYKGKNMKHLQAKSARRDMHKVILIKRALAVETILTCGYSLAVAGWRGTLRHSCCCCHDSMIVHGFGITSRWSSVSDEAHATCQVLLKLNITVTTYHTVQMQWLLQRFMTYSVRDHWLLLSSDSWMAILKTVIKYSNPQHTWKLNLWYVSH